MRIKFYRAFNSMYSKCYKFSEPVLLHLVISHSKPFLLYGMNAISPTKSELNSLEYTFRSSVRKIFKIAHVASVLQFMNEKYITDCGLTSRLRFMQKCLGQDNDVTKLLMCCLSKCC